MFEKSTSVDNWEKGEEVGDKDSNRNKKTDSELGNYLICDPHKMDRNNYMEFRKRITSKDIYAKLRDGIGDKMHIKAKRKSNYLFGRLSLNVVPKRPSNLSRLHDDINSSQLKNSALKAKKNIEFNSLDNSPNDFHSLRKGRVQIESNE